MGFARRVQDGSFSIAIKLDIVVACLIQVEKQKYIVVAAYVCAQSDFILGICKNKSQTTHSENSAQPISLAVLVLNTTILTAVYVAHKQ